MQQISYIHETSVYITGVVYTVITGTSMGRGEGVSI